MIASRKQLLDVESTLSESCDPKAVQVLASSLQNPSIRYLFAFVQLCAKHSLSPAEKMAVIKCLRGFTEKSTKLAYKAVYGLLVRQERPENDSM